MKNQMSKKNVLGYIAIVVALTMVVTATTTLIQMKSNATAESAPALQTASTVVASPFTEAVEKVHGSVVGVNNYGTTSSRSDGYYFGFGYGYGDGNSNGDNSARQVLKGSGSGVVIAKGYVLTNYHVVEDATSLEVTVASENDKAYPATLMGSDSNLDLAILKVENLNLDPVVVGDSDALKVGDWAICIGNPLSFTGTTTVGVISALGREISNYSYDRYGRRTEIVNAMIQTDASINAGNSGGGMFNVSGELVGVPSMKYTGSAFSGSSVEGIGMAIPINSAKPLIEEVLSGKTTDTTTADNANATVTSTGKPRIGVTVTNMNTSNPAVSSGLLPNGAYVTNVESGSPAEKAGLKVGDIVVEVDGTVITSTSQMVSILQAKNEGETAQVKVYRVQGGLDSVQDYNNIPDGEYVDLTVTLAMLDNVKQ